MASLAQHLTDAGQSFADKDFLCYRQDGELRSITVGEFVAVAACWGHVLQERGVAPGDRVAIITPKCADQVRAFYACWWCGAIAVPVCETLGDLETGFIIRDCEPALILAHSALLEKVSADNADIPLASLSDIGAAASGAEGIAPVPVPGDEPAALIYTSGSTGMPKGVVLTHGNFRTNALSALDRVDIRVDDAVMSVLPYWHSFALVVEVVIAPLAGARVILPRDKRDFQRNIAFYAPTIVLLVPRIADALRAGIRRRIAEATPRVQVLFKHALRNAACVLTPASGVKRCPLRMLLHWLFFDPFVFRRIRKRFGGRLRFFISGGAPLDVAHQEFFMHLGLPVYQGYGLTEATPAISANCPRAYRLGSSGQMLSWLLPEQGGDYTFKDEEGKLGRQLRGELLVRGQCVMKGYWRHRDASAKSLADGWLHTGDVGYVDADGFLFLDGRQGNMLVLTGGEKVHPEHVEDAVRNCPLVTEAMVIGEACKNIYVCVNVDAEAAAGLGTAAVHAEVRRQVLAHTSHLAAFQKPKDVLILPEFTPDDGTLTVTLKIRRHSVWKKHGAQIREFLQRCGESMTAPETAPPSGDRGFRNMGEGRDGQD